MKNKGHLTLPKLIKATIVSELFGHLNKNVAVTFPQEIGGYRLKKEFKNGEIKSKMFVFALYEDKRGEKALAKMWRGKFKDFVYHTLLNEIAVCKTLNKVVTRLSNSIPPEFEGIRIPKYIGAIQDKKSLLILTEYIDCVSADKTMSHDAFEIYKKCSNFLRFLGSQMTRKEKEGISKRTAFSVASLYPLFLIRAITIRPRLTSALIKGMPIVLNSLPAFLKKRDISLGHRDLQLRNIMVSKKKLYIVDLQFCIFSYELYDFFMVLRTRFNDKSFRNKMLREVTRRLQRGEDKNWIKGLIVISAAHGLSGNNLPKEIENNSINFLKLAVRAKIGEKYGRIL